MTCRSVIVGALRRSVAGSSPTRGSDTRSHGRGHPVQSGTPHWIPNLPGLQPYTERLRRTVATLPDRATRAELRVLLAQLAETDLEFLAAVADVDRTLIDSWLQLTPWERAARSFDTANGIAELKTWRRVGGSNCATRCSRRRWSSWSSAASPLVTYDVDIVHRRTPENVATHWGRGDEQTGEHQARAPRGSQ